MRFALLNSVLSLPLLTSAYLGAPYLGAGEGDRFGNGHIVPMGLGTQPANTIIDTLLNVEEINSAMRALDMEYDINRFTARHPTVENRPVWYGKVGGAGRCDEAIRIFLNAGLYGNMRGGPDGLLYFISDLLYANKHELGLQYGEKSYTHAQVKAVLSAGIVFVPLSNPDGYAFDQKYDSCWSKNRNKENALGDSDFYVGVNLNRNFDFIFNLTASYRAAREILGEDLSSFNPSSEIYKGRIAFSERETQNIKALMDRYTKLGWFVNLGSAHTYVAVNWAHADSQNFNENQNFIKFTHDVKNGVWNNHNQMFEYREYMPSHILIENGRVSAQTSRAMTNATGRRYMNSKAYELETASGTAMDYAFSRHIVDDSFSMIRGFEIGLGYANMEASCNSYPNQQQHNQNMLELGAGYMELVLQALEVGLGDPVRC